MDKDKPKVKRCSACKKLLTLDNFYINRTKCCFQNYCKKCDIALAKIKIKYDKKIKQLKNLKT